MSTAPRPGSAEIDAAHLLLSRMGLSVEDLLGASPARPPSPTFAEYIPVVSAAVGNGTRRVYDPYWNRILEHWGERRLDEPTPSEIKRLIEHIRTHVVARRNARGGRSAGEHLVAALRCIYRHAEQDGHISAADNPARKVEKPRRLASTRRAVDSARLAEINHVAETTGNDGRPSPSARRSTSPTNIPGTAPGPRGRERARPATCDRGGAGPGAGPTQERGDSPAG